MKELRSQHFPPADKPAAEAAAPLGRYQRCLFCPKCNAESCRLLTSNTPKNPGRQFYICPASDHKFFKWADEVKPNEFIDVPDCGGCSAGACRVRREASGPNAGRILFMCRVKELKEMVLATLRESELSVSDDDVEAIVDKTLQEADLNGDGKIDPEEWKNLVAKYPSIIKNMTLPHLREITLAFPNFVMATEVPDSELVC